MVLHIGFCRQKKLQRGHSHWMVLTCKFLYIGCELRCAVLGLVLGIELRCAVSGWLSQLWWLILQGWSVFED